MVRRSQKDKFGNRFIVLKGMSSSTPTMLNNIFDTEDFVGGGFYFCWQGYGVAIDPGYYFIKNLHHYGLSVLDIDAVIITHEHVDHNNDMRLLDDLHFAVSRYAKDDTDSHMIDWYLDKVSFGIADILRNNKVGFQEKANRLHCIQGNEVIELVNESLMLETFPTEHVYSKEAKAYGDHTFGCKFLGKKEGLQRTLVYTSDTKYFSRLSEIIKDTDIVIANISGIYEDDFMLIKEKNSHLGYYA